MDGLGLQPGVRRICRTREQPAGSWEACKTQQEESSSPKMGSIQVLAALTEIRVI